MPSQAYALEENGPKRLEVSWTGRSWSGLRKDVTFRLDGLTKRLWFAPSLGKGQLWAVHCDEYRQCRGDTLPVQQWLRQDILEWPMDSRHRYHGTGRGRTHARCPGGSSARCRRRSLEDDGTVITLSQDGCHRLWAKLRPRGSCRAAGDRNDPARWGSGRKEVIRGI